MTNDALINGEVRILDSDEKKAAEEFHRKRYPFIWINGKLTFNDNMDDDRDHQHWVCEDYGISVEEFEKLPRGYILPGRIQLFIGSDFSKIPYDKIAIDDIMNIINRHMNLYPNDFCRVFNGVTVGKVGEIWPPIDEIVVDVHRRYMWIKNENSHHTKDDLGPQPVFIV